MAMSSHLGHAALRFGVLILRAENPGRARR
jgi:hypothetical protein